MFQQHVLDQYCKEASERLDYLRRNQIAFRVSHCTPLCKQLGHPQRIKNRVHVVHAGHMFIISSIYVGCDRCRLQNMHNMIAISNKVYYPDIFRTMTCCAQLLKIKNALLRVEIVVDRPEILCPCLPYKASCPYGIRH